MSCRWGWTLEGTATVPRPNVGIVTTKLSADSSVWHKFIYFVEIVDNVIIKLTVCIILHF